MSKTATDKPVIEETPAGKLGIETITPSMFRKLIEIMATAPRALAVWGPSGIGKTAIPMQVARERGAPYVDLHMPTMTPEDFHIPSTAKDTTTYYDRRIPRRFQTAIEYVEKMKKEHGGTVPPHLRPIIAIEELNRAVDKSVTRGAFVLIGDRVIGDFKLDENYQFIVTMNPTGGGMAVNEFERDPAMRRRLLSVYMTASPREFLEHARASGFHSEVIEYVTAHVAQFYDDLAAKAGRVFACPATWEGVSLVCKAFEAAKVPFTGDLGRAAIAGYIGNAITETFIEFVRDRTTTITPDDVLMNYGDKSDTRKRLQALLNTDGGRLDRVTDLIHGVVIRMFSMTDKDPQKIAKPLATFMCDLPQELFLTMVQSMSKETKDAAGEARAWMTKLNAGLNKEPAFASTLTKYHGAKDRAKAEAKEAGIDTAS